MGGKWNIETSDLNNTKTSYVITTMKIYTDNAAVVCNADNFLFAVNISHHSDNSVVWNVNILAKMFDKL